MLLRSRQILLTIVATILWAFVPKASAETQINAIPTAWRLQSYGGSTVLWYTGSPCYNGQLLLNSSWSVDQSKLLWATIMAAKASRLPVFVYYVVDSSGNCIITSFGLDTQ